MWSAILRFLGALFAGSRKPPQAPVQAPAPTLAAPSGDAAYGLPEGSLEGATGLVVMFEGFSEAPYPDPAGKWTIGYGSTRDKDGNPVTQNTPRVSKDDGRALMTRDLGPCASAVGKCVNRRLNKNQAAALIDFSYNLGVGAFKGSTLLHKINMWDFETAANEFPKWVYAGGKVLPGLVKRRAAEQHLFEAPV